jgi:hypothetical protein
MTQTFARIVDGIVVEIASFPDDTKITDCFQANIAAMFQACGTSVKQGYTYDGKKFSAPVVPAITTDDLSAYAAAKRYAIETGGIVINGMSVMTDRVSQALITGAYNYVDANSGVMVQFKTASGFIELTAAQVKTLANAVAAHVQASFAAECAIDQQIISGTITKTEEIDVFAWSSNN